MLRMDVRREFPALPSARRVSGPKDTDELPGVARFANQLAFAGQSCDAYP